MPHTGSLTFDVMSPPPHIPRMSSAVPFVPWHCLRNPRSAVRSFASGLISFPAFSYRVLHRVRSFMSGLQVTSPYWRAASFHSLDFAHVAVLHDGHMTIVPGDCDRVPTRLSDNAAISGITLPANASALLEVLRFGGVHVAPPFAWVACILGEAAWRCLTYSPSNRAAEFSGVECNEKPQRAPGDGNAPGLLSSGWHATKHSRCTPSRLRSDCATT